MTPYYEADGITLYHGDCLEIDAWLAADVLCTDPPYGRGWSQHGRQKQRVHPQPHAPIANDHDTSTRDAALEAWGNRPAVVFGDPLALQPPGAKIALAYVKGPTSGALGAVGGYRRNVEMVYLCCDGWGSGIGGRSAVIGTNDTQGHRSVNARHSHPHAKPGDVMESLITHCPPGTIADPFAGSGSTLVAARNLGRRAIGVELEERYCEIAARRLAQGVLL